MTKRLFNLAHRMSRQRPGVRQPYGAFRGLGDTRKRHRAGAIQDALALLCVLVFASLACTTHAADWEPLPPLPEPNGGFVCGVHQGKIVIAGGTRWVDGKKRWPKAVHVFDPLVKRWSTTADLSSSIAYAVVFHGGDTFAFLGGFDGAGAASTFAWGDTQQIELHEDLFLPRTLVLAAGGAVGEWLIISGGTNNPANIAGLRRYTYAFKWGRPYAGMHSSMSDPVNPRHGPYRHTGAFEISRMADYPGKPFAVAASAVVGEELLVFGGMNYDAAADSPVNSTEAYAFSPAKNTWRTLRPLAVANRGLCAVTLDDQHIYLAGGYTDDFTASAYIYDVKADNYEAAKPLPYAAMVSLIKLGGFVYCLGGEDKKQSRTDKCCRIPLEALRLP